MNVIGERIRTLRVTQQLSQGQLAELTGINRVYISDIERGQRNPKWPTLERFAQALGTSAVYLQTGAHPANDKAA